MGAPNLDDFYSKPDYCIKAHMMAREMYKWDQPPFVMDPGYLTEIWGGKAMRLAWVASFRRRPLRQMCSAWSRQQRNMEDADLPLSFYIHIYLFYL